MLNVVNSQMTLEQKVVREHEVVQVLFLNNWKFQTLHGYIDIAIFDSINEKKKRFSKIVILIKQLMMGLTSSYCTIYNNV